MQQQQKLADILPPYRNNFENWGPEVSAVGFHAVFMVDLALCSGEGMYSAAQALRTEPKPQPNLPRPEALWKTLQRDLRSQQKTMRMGGCQNYGPFWVLTIIRHLVSRESRGLRRGPEV